METLRTIEVPTGKILIVGGDYGKLEMLSLQDYGAKVNLNQNKAVDNSNPLMPLTEKWGVTVSTQYGCSSGCKFCDVPKVGPGRNASLNDLMGQIKTALYLPEAPNYTKRLNIHFARMGEPSWNFDVIECATQMAKSDWEGFNVHPVVSTMMPKSNCRLAKFVDDWMFVKYMVYEGNAGLQLSINSTDEGERRAMFSGSSLSLEKISEIVSKYRVRGRKITLNFAVANYRVDADYLATLFSPDRFICKLTPMHKTYSAVANDIRTNGEYTSPEPYQELEHKLQKAGFETLVFIASSDEDEGRITCGNAILSGSTAKTKG